MERKVKRESERKAEDKEENRQETMVFYANNDDIWHSVKVFGILIARHLMVYLYHKRSDSVFYFITVSIIWLFILFFIL